MKAIIITVAVLLTTLPAFASRHPWEDISGCYVTEVRNGQPVTTEPGFEYGMPISFTEKVADGNITDVHNRTLPGMEFFMYLKYDENEEVHYSTYHPVFATLGTFYQKGSTRIHTMSEKLVMNYEGRHDFTMISKTEIERLADGRLRVKVQRTVPEVPSGEFDMDDELVLAESHFSLRNLGNPFDSEGVCSGVAEPTPPAFSPVSR